MHLPNVQPDPFKSSSSSLLALTVLKNIVTSHSTVEYNTLVLETTLGFLIFKKCISKKLLCAWFGGFLFQYQFTGICNCFKLVSILLRSNIPKHANKSTAAKSCIHMLYKFGKRKYFWHLFKIYFSHQHAFRIVSTSQDFLLVNHSIKKCCLEHW